MVPVGAWPTGIAAGAGYLWVTNQGDGTVTRFHPETHMPDPPLTVGAGPTGIAVTDDAAWVTNNLEGSLFRIDAETLTVTARETGRRRRRLRGRRLAATTCGSVTSTPAI